MRVAKRFGWEAAHRLPLHMGQCRNLHGHSYRMTVVFEGEPREDGMVIDFQEIKALVKPLVDTWDHATLVSANDTRLAAAVKSLDVRHVILPFETTAENLCILVADYVRREGSAVLTRHGIQEVTIRIYETESCYAEHRAAVG